MRFTVINCDQRSDTWFQVRCGRLTGSRAGDMLATIKSGEAAARRDYRLQLVCERLTGIPQEEGFVNAAMQRGIDKEAEAFNAYEAVTGHLVQRSGFLAHATHQAGCSLDGYLDDYRGILELKVPKSATHLRYLREGIVPKEHMPQVLHNLWITDADYCDFMSFDDRFPHELQIFRTRIWRHELDLPAYERAALAFLAEVERDYEVVQTMANLPRQLEQAVAQ